MATFEEVWRRARLELPAVPALLLRAWAQEAYAKAADVWGWSFLRAESALVILDARSIVVGVTNGLTTVTSAALFVSTDAGRQLRIGDGPIYTIRVVTDASTIELDLPYSRDTDAAATAQIYDAYATMPADFARFLVIADLYNQRPIPFWFTEDQLARADIGRTSSDGIIRALVAQKYSSATATLGRVRYEYWPSPTNAASYPYLYERDVENLSDSDELPGPFSTRPDVLRAYLLWKAALWPGTVDQRNPSFSPVVAREYKKEWDDEIQSLSLIDDDIYPQQYLSTDWAQYGGMYGPTSLLRQSDATVQDYL